jgi:hypothetical protein
MPLITNANGQCMCAACVRWREETSTTVTDPAVTLTVEDVRSALSFLEHNGSPTITQETPPMPIHDTVTCYNCSRLITQLDRSVCEICFEHQCTACAHVHTGPRCADCGYRMLAGQVGISCAQCGVRSLRRCDYHYDIHTFDAHNSMSDNYGGRPDVAGWGREATLDFIDDPYTFHPKAHGKRAAALEVEVEFDETSGATETVVLPSACGVTEDGSLSNGIEVTTPPAKGEKLVSLVMEVMNTLNENGYVAEHSCGLHTHIDLRDYVGNRKFLSHLFNAFYAVEDILFAMQTERRHASTYSYPMRQNFDFFHFHGKHSGDFDYRYYGMEKSVEGKYRMDSEKARKYASNRYNAFNFHSVYFRGSLEVRLHEGTVDPNRALFWIDLLQSIVARVEEGHSYAAMKRLAEMPVTKKKVNAFARYFRLRPEQKAYVIDRIVKGQGFGFDMTRSISWGAPAKGRPARHEPPARRTTLVYVGQDIICGHCNYSWALSRYHTECPSCYSPLINTYGERTYRRSASFRSRRSTTLDSFFSTTR